MPPASDSVEPDSDRNENSITPIMALLVGSAMGGGTEGSDELKHYCRTTLELFLGSRL